MTQQDSQQEPRTARPDEARLPHHASDAGHAGSTGTMDTANTTQGLSAGERGAEEMGSQTQGALGTSGEFSNQDDVAGFGPQGAGGLHGDPPTWFGTPLARAEEEAEQGGNLPATTTVPETADATHADGANRNDSQVSAGDLQAADQQAATGTAPGGAFEPVGGEDSISAQPGAPNPD